MYTLHISIILMLNILFSISLHGADIIVLMGSPGSGKGTFSQYAKSHFVQINPGDLLRKEIAKDSLLGMEIKEKVGRGALIDNAIVWQLVHAEFTKILQEKKGVILDAFPLSIENLDSLTHFMEENPELKFSFFYLEAPLDVCISRIVGRKSCLNCGSLYHDATHPSKIPDFCDDCGKPLAKRADDSEEHAFARVKKAHDKLNGVLQALEVIAVQVTFIDTSGSIEDCHIKYKLLLEYF